MYYIIMKVGWEYNDEYYYRGEDEGGTPQKVYRDRDKALLECRERNAFAFAGLHLEEYLDDGFEDGVLLQLKRLGVDEDTRMVVKDTRLEVLLEIADLLPSIRFYEVVECE